MARKPPRLANWLLEGLGYTFENPALAGDLLEEYQAGRSAAWYWRQTWTVILKAPARKRFAGLCSKALLAGYLAQLPVVYALWKSHLLPEVHGAVGWTFATFLAGVGLMLAMFLRGAITGGRTPDDVRRLLWIQGQRSPVRRVAATSLFVQALGEGVLVYCLAVMFQPADLKPLGGVIGVQLALLSLQILRLGFWTLAPVGIRFPGQPGQLGTMRKLRGWVSVLISVEWLLTPARSYLHHDGIPWVQLVTGVIFLALGLEQALSERRDRTF